jgi:hypothetical protein
MWELIEIEHEEALASVVGRPNAHTFKRTSYCLAPSSWRELPKDDLAARLEHVLLAGYAKRNSTLRNTEDPTPMELLEWDFIWVERADISSRPWTRAFHAFRISADGNEWHIVKHSEVTSLFDSHLLGASQPSDQEGHR